MAECTKTVDDLLKEAVDGYKKMMEQLQYDGSGDNNGSESSLMEGAPPLVLYCCCAPGRVNLIGGHVDYNDGFVLPMALPMVTVCVGAPLASFPQNKCLVKTTSTLINPDQSQIESIDLPVQESYFSENSIKDRGRKWTDYVAATIFKFNGKVLPFAMCIATSVPIGGGLSSSAALEVATYTFLEMLSGDKEPVPSIEKALACQKAEHLVGMPCGIMDQLISVMANPGCLLLIDCRTLTTENIALNDPTIGVLITNSNVKHELTGSEYPQRKKMCEEVAKLMGVKNLRDVSIPMLQKMKNEMSDEMYRRALHVVTEIERTTSAVKALQENDHKKFGQLITQSHESLRDNYNVSCEELDQLVDIVIGLDGVYGSRLVGGGFGGCTITWLQVDKCPLVIDAIKNRYKGTATFYLCQAAEGARVLQM